MCVLIPLQRASAEITMEVVGKSTKTTKTTDTDDITFTVRITSEAGDQLTLALSLALITIPRGIAFNPNEIEFDPAKVEIDGKGTHDVTITIGRSGLPQTLLYDVEIGLTFGIWDADDNLQGDMFELTVELTLPPPPPPTTIADIKFAVEGDEILELRTNEVKDILFPLIVTNNSSNSTQVNFAVILKKDDWWSENGVNVPFTPDQVRIEKTKDLSPQTSEKVTLSISRNVFSEVNGYTVIVEVALAADIYKFAQPKIPLMLRVNVLNVYGIFVESMDELPKRTKITDTEDISCTLRVTNLGSEPDRIVLEVYAPDGTTAALDKSLVDLFPDSFEDITLTIPRDSLTEAGTYPIGVTAISQNDPSVQKSIFVQTIITDDSLDTHDPSLPIGGIEGGGTDDSGPTQPDLSTHKVVLSEFMFESEGGENSLPQWFEVYNNTNEEINLRRWRLAWRSRLAPSSSVVSTTYFSDDFLIPAQQCRLIVTSLGRHSGVGNLSDDAVYQALAQDDIANRNRLITRGGFSLKLINPNDILVDQISTLSEDMEDQAWQLPICLINGVRSSLIRRFDDGVPRSGLERRGWRRAYDTKRLVAGLYYGSSHDFGTPGYRRGKPLPVELSQFSAKLVTDEVVISWTTESELNNAGFNIFRSTSRTKNFRRINAKLIQGAGTTGQRNTYQFIDKTAKPDVAYYYRLEEVDLSGTRVFLNTYRLRGVIKPTGKHITYWATLKDNR